MYADPEDKRNAVCKVRFTAQKKRQLQMEAQMAGMQLSTYLWELAELGRAFRAAEAVKEMYGITGKKNSKA